MTRIEEIQQPVVHTFVGTILGIPPDAPHAAGCQGCQIEALLGRVRELEDALRRAEDMCARANACGAVLAAVSPDREEQP